MTVYQKPHHLALEKKIADWFGKRIGATGKKLSGNFHPFDYVFDRPGERPLHVEVKSRTTAHDHYPSYSIEHSKVHHAEINDLAAVVLVEFEDGIGMLDLRKPYEVKTQTRRDRNITSHVAHYDKDDIVMLGPKLSS